MATSVTSKEKIVAPLSASDAPAAAAAQLPKGALGLSSASSLYSCESATCPWVTYLADTLGGIWNSICTNISAFFDWLSGTPEKPGPVVLPSPVMTLISDYLFMPEQHREFLFILNEKLIHYETYRIYFRMTPLIEALTSVQGLSDSFSAPHLPDKIKAVFQSHYYMLSPKDKGFDEYVGAELHYVCNYLKEKEEECDMENNEKSADFYFRFTSAFLSQGDRAEEIVSSLRELTTIPVVQAVLRLSRKALISVPITKEQVELITIKGRQ